MRVKFTNNTAGGKGLNVARVAGLLGEDALATGIIGGHAGSYLEELAERDNIKTDFVKCGAETRTCLNIRDMANGSSTELLESGPAIDLETQELFYEKFRKIMRMADVAVISGSLPQGISPDYCHRLISLAKSYSVAVLADSSGNPLRECIKARPRLIKPNLSELSQLFRTTISTRADILMYAGRLQKEGIETVAVSLGADGVLVLAKDGVYEGRPPKVEVVNTVGCGDSMVAGFAAGISRGADTAEGIRLAVAASAANAMSLETGSFKEEYYNAILPEVVVEKIK
jgi:tagatose 6-phosphate kinase